MSIDRLTNVQNKLNRLYAERQALDNTHCEQRTMIFTTQSKLRCINREISELEIEESKLSKE